MADQAGSKAAAPVLTPHDQELMVTALRCLENNEIKIDFVKFATEAGFKDKSSASSKWGKIKRKIEAGAKPPSGAVAKATNPKTPRKTKEPKTLAPTAKTGVKPPPKSKELDEDAPTDAVDNDGDAKMEMGVNGADHSAGAKSEMNDDPTTEDADGDSTMVNTPGSVDKGEGKTSVADSMSSGEMSPPATPAPTKAKKAAPKTKATPRTPRTPKTPTGADATTASGDATETPAPGSSVSKKRGRKTKAPKEAAAAAAGESDGEEGEKPAKKPRKTPVKKATKEEVAEGEDTARASESGDGKEKVAKNTRKPTVKKAQKEDKAEGGVAVDSGVNEGEGGEKEKPAKKPRKTPVKKKEDASPAGEVSPASEPAKEKKKAGPKPGVNKAKKAATVTKSTEPEVTNDEAEEENDQEATAKVAEAAKLANAVTDGKKIEAKAASTTNATVSSSWGTPINSPSPTKSEVTTKLANELATAAPGTIEGAKGNTIVVAPEVVDPIKMGDSNVGDTIVVAAA